MTEADLARLALAKRAFEATRPSEAEVATGVRRARLALRRPKARRTWISKGLVFVVLAIGSLAYAKPHALGEVVERVLQLAPASHGGHANGPGVALALSDDERPRTRVATPNDTAPSRGAATSDVTEPREAAATGEVRATSEAPHASASAKPTVVAKKAPAAQPAASATAESTPTTERALSEWGRIGQALERGDEQTALAELGTLSRSDDPRTRDKADLGRAQLLLAHGNREDACALARSLTHRAAGGRIERQAQALLSSCGR
ncbi:MAG TPA: hypothetical protein VHB79_25965 [Polyangiaceae bacterium]|nr:hypothetical protein [Polyangiaceae bacterium]